MATTTYIAIGAGVFIAAVVSLAFVAHKVETARERKWPKPPAPGSN
jgi:hypothetical protein